MSVLFIILWIIFEKFFLNMKCLMRTMKGNSVVIIKYNITLPSYKFSFHYMAKFFLLIARGKKKT